MKIILLGDLHYANYSDPTIIASRERFFEGLFQQVAAHQADMVFAVGDTTHRGTLAELIGQTAVAQRCGVNLMRITGNHDTDSLFKPELAPFFLGNRNSVSTTELYTSFDSDLIRFILLDTARSKMSSINWSGYVSEEQLDWLSGQIERYNKAAQPPHLIVMGHHPLFGTTDRSTEKWLNIDNSQAMREVFSKLTHLPGIYICGHNHSNSLAGPDAEGWYYIQLGAPLVCLSYGLLTIDETNIQFKTVDINLSDPQFRKDFEITRSSIDEGFSVYPFEEMYGAESDHFLKI